jgi:2-polyprenyl-3-methyl-5-hydroxy-6-metoxy-1,4-benzoquinol methylase
MNRLVTTNHWDDLYKQVAVEEMPWFYARLDRDVEKALAELRIVKGQVLDVGSGPGTQAIELARLGFNVTGIDVSEAAVEKARSRASDEGVKVQFICADILKLKLHNTFDLIVDRGCFHVLEGNRRKKYVSTVSRLLKSHGYLLLKTFSHKEPPGRGPNRFRPDEIEELFSRSLQISSLRDTTFHGNHRKPPRALFCVMQKS